MYNIELNEKSLKILENVHPKLSAVVKEARNIGEVYFEVVEGLRTKETQELMFEKGAAGSLLSPYSFGFAVSILLFWEEVPIVSSMAYEELATTMKYAAQNLGVGLKWGGAPHYSNICSWNDDMGQLMVQYLSACIDKDVVPNINPGYFELVIN
jgi:peptidoglycan LD-endopeptidase CwlK